MLSQFKGTNRYMITADCGDFGEFIMGYAPTFEAAKTAAAADKDFRVYENDKLLNINLT